MKSMKCDKIHINTCIILNYNDFVNVWGVKIKFAYQKYTERSFFKKCTFW